MEFQFGKKRCSTKFGRMRLQCVLWLLALAISGYAQTSLPLTPVSPDVDIVSARSVGPPATVTASPGSVTFTIGSASGTLKISAPPTLNGSLNGLWYDLNPQLSVGLSLGINGLQTMQARFFDYGSCLVFGGPGYQNQKLSDSCTLPRIQYQTTASGDPGVWINTVVTITAGNSNLEYSVNFRWSTAEQQTVHISTDGPAAAACGGGGAASPGFAPRATPKCFPGEIDAVQVTFVPEANPRDPQYPLVYGKSAYVRVFLQSGGPKDVSSGITGTLKTPSGRVIVPRNANSAVAHVGTPDPQDINSSLNFPLSPGDVSNGLQQFHVEVSLNGQVQQAQDFTIDFDKAGPVLNGKVDPGWPDQLNIGYFLLCSPTECPANPMDPSPFLNNIFPVRDNDGVIYGQVLANQTWTKPILSPDGQIDPKAGLNLTKAILLIYSFLTVPNPLSAAAGATVPDQLVVWCPPPFVGLGLEEMPTASGLHLVGRNQDEGFGHIWWLPASTSVTLDALEDAPLTSTLLAHSLAHNFGLADSTNSPQVGYGGFDVSRYRIVDEKSPSLMSGPASGRWPSGDDYKSLLAAYVLDPGPGKQREAGYRRALLSGGGTLAIRQERVIQGSAQPVEYLIISGDVSPDGTVATLDAGFRMTSSNPGSSSDHFGSHCLRFDGNPANDYCFHPFLYDTSSPGAAGSFVVKAPFPSGAATVSLIQRDPNGGDTVLTSLTASPTPPTLTILSPRNGDTLMGAGMLQWTGTDAAGLPLTYALQYSSDNGASWVPLTFTTTDTQYQIDSGSMVGPQVMIRVLATNGLQTASAVVGPLTLLQSATIAVSPSALDFGNLSPASGPVKRTIAVTNTGTGPFKLTANLSGDPAFQLVSPNVAVWPGKQITLTIQIDPASATSGRGMLTLSTPDPSQPPAAIPLIASLSGGGSGGGPTISVSPPSLSFPSVAIGQRASLPLSVANNGTTDLHMNSVSISGASFNLVPSFAPQTISAGKTAIINVQFAPTASGPASGSLIIASDDPKQPSLSVPLSGTGASASNPAIVVTAQTFDFGTVNAGAQKDIVLQVTNTGSATLQASASVAPAPPFSVVGPSGTFPVAANGSFQLLTVRFSPIAAGAQTGTLTLTSNDPSNPSLTFKLSANGAGSTGGACVTAPANLVSWYTGDGTANDAAGANNGTLQPGGSYAAGQVAQAFSFDGVNGYVRIGDPASLRLSSALTIEGWINPKALPPGAGNMSAIVTKWAQDFSLAPASDSWGLWIRNDGGAAATLFSGVHLTGGGEPNIQGGSVPLNTWSHIAMTFDAASSQHFIYLNGQVAASGTPSQALLATSRNILIGREDSSAPRSFNGLIDELSIYSRALTASEIQAIYQAGSLGKCKTNAPPAAPVLSVTPVMIDFGTVNVGETSATKIVTITNSGSVAAVLNFGAAAPFKVSPASLTIPGNGGLGAVAVSFAPTSANPSSASLALVLDGQTSPVLTVPLTGVGVNPAPACITAPANIVSWWAADGNANDIAGSNNGSLQPGGSYAAGQVAQAFSLDGAAGYVRIGDPASLRLTSALTIEGWINPKALPAGSGSMAAIITKWAQDFSLASTSDSWGFWIRNNGGSSATLFSGIHVTGGGEPNIQGGSVPLNTWSHIAMTFDSVNGHHVVYLNGQPVATGNPTGALLATSRNILIGREDSSSPRPFNGLIDELSVYSRALTALEIQAIYKAGSLGKCKR